jgi:hypothetical protein
MNTGDAAMPNASLTADMLVMIEGDTEAVTWASIAEANADALSPEEISDIRTSLESTGEAAVGIGGGWLTLRVAK